MRKKGSDWFFVGSLFVVMGVLILFSKFNSNRFDALIKDFGLKAETVKVCFTGSVKKTTPFSVPVGTTVSDALALAKPSLWADVEKLPLSCPIDGPLEIYVSDLEYVTVFLRGEVVGCLELKMPLKSRVFDLKTKIQNADLADLSALKSKRYLKNGEIIEINKKRVE